jgi:hypothetical protein
MSFLNIFNKPKVAPPSELYEPDLSEFEELSCKYEYMLSEQLNTLQPEKIVWLKYREAIIDMLLLNFDTISYFMDSVIYPRVSKGDLDERIRIQSTSATATAWAIGFEYGKVNSLQRSKLIKKKSLDTDDIPSDIMVQLNKLACSVFYIFALVFTEYYDSRFGIRTRHQKEGHIKDTYQGIMKGIMMCFLDGLKCS